MPAQPADSYALYHGKAYEGAVFGSMPSTTRSGLATVGAMPFGRLVVMNPDGSVRPTLAGADLAGDLLGVSVRVQDQVANASDVLQYETGDMVNVLTAGDIWMWSLGSLSAGSDPFVVISGANAGRLAGVAGSGGDAAEQNAALDGRLVVRESTVGAGLVRVQVKF